MRRLGDILVAQGALTREALERALPGVRGRLGEGLRAHTLIRARALAQALAEQQQLAFIQLEEAPPDSSLFRPSILGHYLQHRYLPYRMERGILTLATPEPSDVLQAMLAAYYRMPVVLAVISARDFTRHITRRGASALTRQAQHGLRRRYKYLTADRVLVPHQSRALLLLLVLVLGSLIYNPATVWNILLAGCNLFYFISLAFKIQLYNEGKRAEQAMRRQRKKRDAEVAALDEDSLPTYTILLPMFRESPEVITRLIRNLNALDYPKEKLDIKLICEADDDGTFDALRACQPPETMEIIPVPPSSPRTKPKACNVALQQVRGDFLVIYDAEDAPEPLQLKRAAHRFLQADAADIGCLQAPLNYYNRKENLLTRLFAIEYSSLFRLTLTALQAMKLPIPLGGTSNHLRTRLLKETGGWDAFNVTEDADLGIRLVYFGYRTEMLDSITLEEAPVTLTAWMKQRTRWIKGYIQTWLVFMRDPVELKRRLGRTGYYGFQFFVGAPALTFLLGPIFWSVLLLALLGVMPFTIPHWMLGLCSISFVGGMASHVLMARTVIQLERWDGMRRALLVYPFYWLLHSVAAARAIWQLATAPHYWDKTTHGISRVFTT